MTTDGKAHLEEIIGNYSNKNAFVEIGRGIKDKSQIFYRIENGAFKITKLNEYTFVINYPPFDENIDDYDYSKVKSQECFAYDTKRKALTFLKECGKNEIDTSVPKNLFYSIFYLSKNLETLISQPYNAPLIQAA